jgi:hypothetical protein
MCATQENVNLNPCFGYFMAAMQVLRSMADGADVRGVFYWTLTDNIEWHHGFKMKFGLYEWDPLHPSNSDGTMRFRLRDGSKALQRIHAEWPDGLEEVRAYAKEQSLSPGAVAMHMDMIGVPRGETPSGESVDGGSREGLEALLL